MMTSHIVCGSSCDNGALNPRVGSESLSMSNISQFRAVSIKQTVCSAFGYLRSSLRRQIGFVRFT
jgi:hypothetical protein